MERPMARNQPATKVQDDGMTSPPKTSIDLSTRLALRPKEAAAALGLSERKLRDLRSEIPPARVGNLLLYPVDVIRERLRELAAVEGKRSEKIVEEVLAGMRTNDS